LLEECPYGQVGDRLWVRETFCIACDEAVASTTGDDIARNKPCYRAEPANQPAQDFCEFPHWKPSIHMPRWASRITLEITGVKVERVQDISEEDAKAEGVTAKYVGGSLSLANMDYLSYQAGFCEVWDSINAKRGYGWDVNPWDWALTFKVVE
ncbi:hypothetical protein LCGC14_2074310, partial [marine sediment metagenome]